MLSLAPPPITPRSCTSQIEKMCEWVDDGNGWQNGTSGGYADWVYDDNWWDDDIYIIPDGPNGPPLDLGGSGGGGGGGITVNNATWWKTNPIKRKRWVAFDGNEIKNRGFVLICSDFLVIRCQYGSWWQIVAQVPCDACDQEEAHEKAMEAWCRTAGIDFISEMEITGITEPKLAMMASMMCCDNFTFNLECAATEFIEATDGFDIDNYISDLNACEIALIAAYPGCAIAISQNMKVAQFKTNELFGGNYRNECSDAFRHAFFLALNSKSCGGIMAKLFGDAHECFVPQNLASEAYMDIFNNGIGIDVASENPYASINDLVNIICTKLADGELRVFESPEDGTSDVIPSDGCECE